MVTRTFDILTRYKLLYPSKTDALATKINGEWRKYSIDYYVEKVNMVSFGLLSMGFQKGDKIATISNNRPEWNFIDMGMAQIGVVQVPIYPTLSSEEFAHIFNHAEPKALIVSDKLLYDKLKNIGAAVGSIKHLLTFNEVESVTNWTVILKAGEKYAQDNREQLEKIKESIQPGDLATLIYTSGTTGTPKGVMLSHFNLVSNFITTAGLYDLGAEHRALSFLPLCHIYERSLNYNYQYKGISIYYAENMGTIIENMKEVKPHIFITVPRLLERIYSGIIGKSKNLTYSKKIVFIWGLNLAVRFERDRKNSWLYEQQRKIADKLIFSKWREALGGEVKYIVSGSATLQPRIARVFGAAGFEILEGYGLTETGPVISVTNPLTNEVRYGTVGPPIPGVEVKLASDGEILCKGPNVMMGYYKDPKQTSEVIDEDGWFHTGDVGVFENGKYLKITDRKKEIFKLSSGKYVSPQVLESKFKQSQFIEQIMVIGENEKFASALVSPNFTMLQSWCNNQEVRYNDTSDLIRNPKVIEHYQREIAAINKMINQTEHLKRFRLVSEEWSPITGELSPTLKLKRKFILDKYRYLKEEIYSGRPEDESLN